MYKRHFGLSRQPFSIAPNPRFLYMSPQHREALAHLLYGVRTGGGFVQLTGEVGTGKTTICRCLVERLPQEVDVALILNPRVSALELVASLCDELKIDYPRDTTSIKVLTDALNAFLLANHAAHRRTVLIIDEAQCLNTEALEQVRLLTNLETSTAKLLQIILVGQPELRELLARDDLRQLAQRITARFHLMPISRAETAAYIRHRLQLAGSRDAVFDERVIDQVHRLAKGVPRLINVLCDRAMLGAFVEGRRAVDTEILRKAAAEVLPEAWRDGTLPRPWRRGLAMALLLGVGLAVGLWYGLPRPGGPAPVTAPAVTDAGPPTPTAANGAAPASLPSQAPAAMPTPMSTQMPTPAATARPASEQAAQAAPTPPVATAPAIAEDGGAASAAAVPEASAAEADTTPGDAPVASPSPPAGAEATLPAATEPPQVAPPPLDTPPPPEPAAAESPATLAGRLADYASSTAAARAWAGLYRLWGYESAAATDEQACAQAPVAGLACLQGAGSWGLLRRFDRPALLLLQAGGARPVAALMVQIDGDRVALEVDGEPLGATRAEVERQWYGAYRLLWKRPPAGNGVLRLGMRGPDVRWLRERLAAATGQAPAAADPALYDEPLASAVEAFQREQGLVADGVAGAHTFIVLNNLVADPEIPRLLRSAAVRPE